LLGRSAWLLPSRDPMRVALLPDLAAVLAETGRVADAQRVLEEAVEAGADIGDERAEWRARIQQTWWDMNAGQVLVAATEPRIRAGIAALERMGDEYGLASAWRIAGDVHNTLGQTEEWLACLNKAFDYARRSRNRQEEVVTLAIIGGAMFFGMTPAADGIARLSELRTQVADDPLLEAQTLRPLGGFTAIRGDVDEGRRLVARAREVVADFGFRWLLGGFPFVSGLIELFAGDLEAAEREYRSGIQIYEAMGEKGRSSTLHVSLANVLYLQGRLDEAQEVARRGAALGADDDVSTQVGADVVQAKVLARKGSFLEGERLIRGAWQAIAGTQYPFTKAETAEAFADVLAIAGKTKESVEFLQRALELYEQKGCVVCAESVRAKLSAAA
jgi:tetratricopeptide (TPR) repeat protein